MMKAAMNFIYAGENERPVRPLNFRPKHLGGLGLVDASTKAKALLLKSMAAQKTETDAYESMYGYEGKYSKYMDTIQEGTTVKEIYTEMLKEKYEKNGSIKSKNIKWSITWKNLEGIRGLSPSEVEFAWRLTQDMLLIGSRIHRANVNKECKKEIDGGECRAIPDISHTFATCKGICNQFNRYKQMLEEILGHKTNEGEILTLSLNHRNRKRIKIAVWVLVKILYGIYNKVEGGQILENVSEDIQWSLQVQVIIGSHQEMIRAKDIVCLYKAGIG